MRAAYQLTKLTRKPLLSTTAITQRPNHIDGVKASVKKSRLDSKKGKLSSEGHSTRRKVVYGRYVEVMNYFKSWSGEGSKIVLNENIQVADFVKITNFL